MNATRDNYTEVRELTSAYVREKLNTYISNRIIPIQVEQDDLEHVVGMGISILETKWPQIGMYLGGDFVKAFVNNDLMEAVGRADETNRTFLHFYVQLLYNFSPRNLED
jgi:hypothetical protein